MVTRMQIAIDSLIVSKEKQKDQCEETIEKELESIWPENQFKIAINRLNKLISKKITTSTNSQLLNMHPYDFDTDRGKVTTEEHKNITQYAQLASYNYFVSIKIIGGE